MESTCTICEKNFVKYTCPKCNIRYCSVSCYKKHNQENCHKKFQEEQFSEWTKVASNRNVSSKSRDELKKHTIEILKRNYEQLNFTEENDFTRGYDGEKIYNHCDDSDGCDVEGNTIDDEYLLMVLNKLEQTKMHDDDMEQILHYLPNNVRNDFEKSLKDGRMSTWLSKEIWNPWWANQTEDKAIPTTGNHDQKITKSSDILDENQYCQGLSPISSITKSSPATTIKYDITNILYAYAYVMRLYNGNVNIDLNIDEKNQMKHSEPYMILDQAHTVYELCSFVFGRISFEKSVLADAASHHSVNSCLTIVIQKSYSPSIFNSVQLSISVIQDLISILESKKHVMRALYEIGMLLSRASEITSTMGKGNYKSLKEKNQWKKAYHLMERKIYFFRCYALEYLSKIQRDELREFIDNFFKTETKFLESKKPTIEDKLSGMRNSDELSNYSHGRSIKGGGKSEKIIEIS